MTDLEERLEDWQDAGLITVLSTSATNSGYRPGC